MDHPLHANRIFDLYRLFLVDILARNGKSPHVTTDKGLCHPTDRFLGQCIQMLRHRQLIGTDITAITEEATPV